MNEFYIILFVFIIFLIVSILSVIISYWLYFEDNCKITCDNLNISCGCNR